MASKEKNANSNLTRQHYQIATGGKETGMKKGGSTSAAFNKGAKMAPKRGRG